MACDDLNLPDLSESDPGKPIKASWGDRVVEAIQETCNIVEGFGPANSVFQRFAGDGSDGNLDVTFSQNVDVPITGLQLENLIIRSGVVLTLTNAGPPWPGQNYGVYRIGVSDTLTFEAPGGGVIDVTGRGWGGGAGGAGAAPLTSPGGRGSTGGTNARAGVLQAGAGAGGGGGRGGNTFVGGTGGASVILGSVRNGGIGGFYRNVWPANVTTRAAGNGQNGQWGDSRSARLLQLAVDLDVYTAGPGGGGGGGGAAGFNAFQPGFSGGAGGAGGGFLILEVNKLDIQVPNLGRIWTRGAAGGATANTPFGQGAGGGGGGGAGAPGIVIFREILPFTFFPVFLASGGAGGTGGFNTTWGNPAGKAGNGGLGRPSWTAIRQV